VGEYGGSAGGDTDGVDTLVFFCTGRVWYICVCLELDTLRNFLRSTHRMWKKLFQEYFALLKLIRCTPCLIYGS